MGLLRKKKEYTSQLSDSELLDEVSQIEPKKFAISLINKNLYYGKVISPNEFEIGAFSMQMKINRVKIRGQINNGKIKIQYNCNRVIPAIVGLIWIIMSISVFSASRLSINGVSRDATIWLKFGFVGAVLLMAFIFLFAFSLFHYWVAISYTEKRLKLTENQ
ncbi:MAG: hypothetical protein ACI857_002513 [Arenicella sp.]|jgi:hypothetical protein